MTLVKTRLVYFEYQLEGAGVLLDQSGQIWDTDEFSSEADLEQVVFGNYRLLFGDQSMIFNKQLISTPSGNGTIPDAYVIDLEEHQWYLVEVELLHHGVYRHIVPQVTKQLNAAANQQMKTLLRQTFLSQVQQRNEYLQLFSDLKIPEIQISDVLDSILSQKPRVSIPIDKIDVDLESWAQSLRYQVDIHVIERYRNRKTDSVIIQLPDIEEITRLGGDTEDVDPVALHALNGKDLLLKLMEAEMLHQGEILRMKYMNREFTSEVMASGHLKLADGSELSPSLAAIQCMQLVKSDRQTANGLIRWKNADGETLSALRLKLFNQSISAA